MALSKGLGLPTTFYFALWRIRQPNSQTRGCSHFTTTRSHGYYLSPRHEKFIFRPFTGETRRTPRAFATFRLALFTTFFTAQMGRGKIQWGAFTSYATTRLCCKEFRFVNSDSEQATVQNFEREKLLVTTVTFQISLHTTQQPLCLESPTSSVGASRTASLLARAGSCPCVAKRLSHSTVARADVQRKHAFVPRWPSN
jgi:hypothetical protein